MQNSLCSRLFPVAFACMALAATGSADIYSFSLGNFGPFDNTTGSMHNFTAAANGPVRGYYVSGDWTRNTGTSASSSMRTILTDGTTTWALAHMGGNTSTAVTAWTFGQFSNRANNSAFNDPATPAGGLTGNTFFGAASANYSVTFRSGSATMTSSMANAAVHLLTDAVTPMTGDLNSPAGMFTRPVSLTTLTTTTPGQYRYNTHSFVAPVSGVYMVAGNWTIPGTGTFYDGHLNLYEGSFDPSNPLTNLVGVDDDGLPVPPATSAFSSSAMWLTLTGGQTYVAVATEFTAGGTPRHPYTVYVAGAVPEPATFAVLGLGAAALLRRRRSKK